jgi:hypothetical protein
MTGSDVLPRPVSAPPKGGGHLWRQFLIWTVTLVLAAGWFAFCVLVWPRLTRPLVLAIAAGVHLGIGVFLGMWTFGLAMIIANVAFVSPWVVRRMIDRSPVLTIEQRSATHPASNGVSQRQMAHDKRKPERSSR